MAIITPYRSSAEIAVPSGGRAGRQVSASAFLTPGQAAMPNALNAVAAGLDKVNKAVSDANLEKRKARNNTALLADQVAEVDSFRTYHSDYQESHKGENALHAVADYEEYFEGRLSGLRSRWGGNPHLMGAVESMFQSIRQGGLNKASAYADQEETAWKQGRLDARWTQVLTDAADPSLSFRDKEAAFMDWEESARMLAGQTFNPETGQWEGGRDIDAGLMKGRQDWSMEIVQEMIAGNRLGEAKSYVEARCRDFGDRADDVLMAVDARIDRLFSEQLKAQREAVKLAGETAEKDLCAMSFDGQLTREAVEEKRDLLSPADYGKFLKRASGESDAPDKSDPDAIILLTRMAIGGDASLREEADEMLRAGRITIFDYRAALNEGQQLHDPVAKQVIREMERLTGAGERNPNPGSRESFVNAKRDYLAWLDSDAGKSSPARERLEMGQRIANNYRTVSTEESLIALPMPLMLVGSRTRPDIAATIARTEEEYRAGRMSGEQYREEAIRIRRMADIIAKMEQEKREWDTRGNG